MKLTRAEHKARAALLGKYYDHRDGTYGPAQFYEDGTMWFETKGLLDCLTLETISAEVSTKRMVALECNFDEWPLESRWEKEDD